MTRVAVIGAGRFGAEHLAAYRALGAELAGVLDADPARARASADEHATTAFPDLDALIGAAPDAVSLVVPAASRGDLVPRLASAGIAVLIEKPLADDPATADALARDHAGLPVLCGHVVRFAEPYVRLRERTPSPSTFAAARIRDAGHAAAYPAEDVVGLTMVHDLDLITWFAGPREWAVTASGRRADGRRVDGRRADGRWVEATAQLRAAGLTATVEAAWRGSTDEDHLSVDGTALEIGGELRDDIYGDALRAELAHFLECAREQRPSELIGLDSAAAAVHLVAAVREALATGGEVRAST